MQTSKVSPENAFKASYDGLWLIRSFTYLDGALLTREAYRLYKAMGGATELRSHTAQYIPVIEPEHFELEFVGSLEIKQTFNAKALKSQS
jgi:hypothetical protein